MMRVPVGPFQLPEGIHPVAIQALGHGLLYAKRLAADRWFMSSEDVFVYVDKASLPVMLMTRPMDIVAVAGLGIEEELFSRGYDAAEELDQAVKIPARITCAWASNPTTRPPVIAMTLAIIDQEGGLIWVGVDEISVTGLAPGDECFISRSERMGTVLWHPSFTSGSQVSPLAQYEHEQREASIASWREVLDLIDGRGNRG